MRTWLGLVAAVVGGATLIARSATQTPPPVFPSGEYVEIDGSKNPELIPEYFAWEVAFRTIALSHRKGSVGLQAIMGLSDTDAGLMFKEAAKQAERDSSCEKRLERLRPLLGKEKVQVINEKTQALQIECRWEVLEARDRLLAALSPDGQTALVIWVQNHKSGIRVRVPKAELDHYWRPH